MLNFTPKEILSYKLKRTNKLLRSSFAINGARQYKELTKSQRKNRKFILESSKRWLNE